MRRKKFPAALLRDEAPLAGEHPYGCPWPELWRRETYERIVPLAWPLITRRLSGFGKDGNSYIPREVERCFRPVVLHLINVAVTPADQVALLRAVPEAWGKMDEPPSQDLEITEEIRIYHFPHVLEALVGDAYAWQKEYDRSLGMPRRLLRHTLELKNGAALWDRHLRARATRTAPMRSSRQGSLTVAALGSY